MAIIETIRGINTKMKNHVFMDEMQNMEINDQGFLVAKRGVVLTMSNTITFDHSEIWKELANRYHPDIESITIHEKIEHKKFIFRIGWKGVFYDIEVHRDVMLVNPMRANEIVISLANDFIEKELRKNKAPKKRATISKKQRDLKKEWALVH